MPKVSLNTNYVPPKSLGDGLNRVKKAFNCTDCIASGRGSRLYKTADKDTVYMSWAELHKTGNILPASSEYSYKDCDTYAGTALRIRRSATCANTGVKPNELMQIVRTKFYSDAVNEGGVNAKPLFAVTDFKVYKSEDAKPIVKYGSRKYPKNGEVPGFVKEIKSEDVPKSYRGKNMPDGNIVYYLKDTVRDGKRAVDMKMFEVGLDVPIL